MGDSGSQLLGFTLGSLRGPELGLEPLQAPLDHAVIGEEELELHGREIAQRIDAAVHVRDGRVTERSDDVHQRVGGAQVAELPGRDGLTGLFRVSESEIAVHHLGICRLLRLEERREPIDALVGDLGDADVRLRLGA